MEEKEIIKKIRKNINEDVPLDIFVKLWFAGKKFSDEQMTNKLKRFAKDYRMDYIIVLGKPTKIRFWEPKEINLLEKGEDNNE